MRGKRVVRLLVALVVPMFVVAQPTGAKTTTVGRVALARIAGPAVPAVPVPALVAAPTTTTTTATTQPPPPPPPPSLVVRTRSRGSVALTFDDGPSAVDTPEVLAILARYGVRATFFVVGSQAEVNPDIVRSIVAAGHTIGNHTWDHVALPTLDDAGYEAQIDRTQTLLTELSGRPVRCARPPFGKIDARGRAQLRARGLQMVRWTKDTEDWKRPGVDAIVSRALAGAEPGGVILLHDGGPDMSQTVAALPAIIEGISAQGFAFAPIC